MFVGEKKRTRLIDLQLSLLEVSPVNLRGNVPAGFRAASLRVASFSHRLSQKPGELTEERLRVQETARGRLSKADRLNPTESPSTTDGLNTGSLDADLTSCQS